MKTVRLLSLLVTLFVVAHAIAQGSAVEKDRQNRSDNILTKVDQLNLMNQILPLVMTREQVRKILPPIEKARQKVREIEKVELEDMKKIDAKIDAALKD